MSVDPYTCPECGLSVDTTRLYHEGPDTDDGHVEELWDCEECAISYVVEYEATDKYEDEP